VASGVGEERPDPLKLSFDEQNRLLKELSDDLKAIRDELSDVLPTIYYDTYDGAKLEAAICNITFAVQHAHTLNWILFRTRTTTPRT
jgi:hypothetical protein